MDDPFEMGNFYSSVWDADFYEAQCREFNSKKYKVLIDNNLKDVPQDLIDKTGDALVEGIRLGRRIIGDEYFDSRFMKSGQVSAKIRVGHEQMLSCLETPTDFLEWANVETVSAAYLHELIEGWREDYVGPGEGVQMMAEFLFCSETDRREESYFKRILDRCSESAEPLKSLHDQGWMWIVDEIGARGETSVDSWNNLKRMKQEMTEDQKIDFIKSYLKVEQPSPELDRV